MACIIYTIIYIPTLRVPLLGRLVLSKHRTSPARVWPGSRLESVTWSWHCTAVMARRRGEATFFWVRTDLSDVMFKGLKQKCCSLYDIHWSGYEFLGHWPVALWIWVCLKKSSNLMFQNIIFSIKNSLKGCKQIPTCSNNPHSQSIQLNTYCKYHHSIVGLSVDIGCPVFFVGFPPWVSISSIIKHLLQIQLHSQAHTLPTEGLHMFISWEHIQEMVEFCPVRTNFIHLVILKDDRRWLKFLPPFSAGFYGI